ncbi:hypothetical protein Nepgr_024508 [Nepenthes gracilis]|uniref:Uncharacterized protein n=1 Tax=Nepenthes gracilis TaxID=150966 RepID=A0AAD3Y048_NEPGR|nr:hypothetical protein Nepgr_024508 [Nepenthes gracilis]
MIFNFLERKRDEEVAFCHFTLRATRFSPRASSFSVLIFKFAIASFRIDEVVSRTDTHYGVE